MLCRPSINTCSQLCCATSRSFHLWHDNCNAAVVLTVMLFLTKPLPRPAHIKWLSGLERWLGIDFDDEVWLNDRARGIILYRDDRKRELQVHAMEILEHRPISPTIGLCANFDM